MEDLQQKTAGLHRQFVQETMKRFLTFIMAASCLLCMVPTVSSAQDYEVPAVTVSKEKIRSGGKTYYSHVVQEKQTLFSISKAYGVSLQDIYDSNPTLNLEKDGLKKNQILLIPVSPLAASTPAHTVKAQPAEDRNVASTDTWKEDAKAEKASQDKLKAKDEARKAAEKARQDELKAEQKAKDEARKAAEKARQDELKAEQKAKDEARKAAEKARQEEQRAIDKAKAETEKAAERAAKARQEEERKAAKAEEEARKEAARIERENRKAEEKAEKARQEEERNTAAASAGYTTYRVKWFDDLESISKKFGVSKEAIMNINGMKDEKLQKQQEIKIPANPGEWEKPSAAVSVKEDRQETRKAVEEAAEGPEESEAQPVNEAEAEEETAEFHSGQTVFIDLLLPFTQQQKADRTMTQDFYAGALLAARDLGRDGINLDLSVFDVTDGGIPVTRSKFDESTFVLGPIAGSGILKAARASGGKAWIVSPLDPNCKAIADTVANVIQAPSSTESQIKDMVEWVKEDTRGGDKVILISQKGSGNANTALAVKEMKASGMKYSTIQFSAAEGKSVLDALAAAVADGTTNRIVLAYDLSNAAFASEVVRSLYTMVNRGKDVILYATSKIRTFDEVETEHLHTVNLHSSVSYYVDYEAGDVQEFLLEYRALYNTEPSRMAFQGYDLMRYFSILGNKYGKRWNARIGEEGKFTGLQSDIRLEKAGRGGYSNTAVRRIVYSPDYTVKIAR